MYLNDFKCSNQTCVKSPRIVEFSNFVCYLNHFKSTCSQIEHASNANLSASNAVVVPRPLPLVHPLDLTRISHQQGITRHYNTITYYNMYSDKLRASRYHLVSCVMLHGSPWLHAPEISPELLATLEALL